MKRFLTAILFAIACAVIPANAFTFDMQGGTINPVSRLSQFNMTFYSHLWYPIDQMVFFGLGGGYQELDNVGYVPLSGSLWMRLPIGRQVLPVITGDIGYMIGSRHQMFWRAAGGTDIKNGDYSSIMIMGGYEFLNHDGRGFAFVQLGILIEI